MSYLDTRDLADELNALDQRADDVADFVANLDTTDPDEIAAAVAAAIPELDPLDEDESTRLAELRQLRDEIGTEWNYGATLIPVASFEDYARDYADDLYGSEVREARWPFTHIDWAAAADDLRQVYAETTFDGTDYLFRF